MIRLVLEIDNKMAHSCSPMKYVEKFILQNVHEVSTGEYDSHYAKIKVKKISQE